MKDRIPPTDPRNGGSQPDAAAAPGTTPLLTDDTLFPPHLLKTGAFEVKELPADAAQAAWDEALAAQERAAAQAPGDFAKTDLVQLDFPPTDIAPLA